MNSRWPQQTVFRRRVEEYCKKNDLMTPRGAVNLVIASDLFDLTEDTLRQFLQDSTRVRPHINTLSRIANMVGCSVTEFIDAPNDPPPGTTLAHWAGLSERERVLARSLMADISSDGLSLAEKEALHKLFQSAKDALLTLKKV